MSSIPRLKKTPVALIATAAVLGAALASPAGAQASRDLSVTQTESADPVRSGDDVTYTITVTNEGTEPVQAGLYIDVGPYPGGDRDGQPNNVYRSITSSQVACSEDEHFCRLGEVVPGSTVQVIAVMRVRDSGANQATLTGCSEIEKHLLSDALSRALYCTPDDPYADDDASDNESTELTRAIRPPSQSGDVKISGLPAFCADADFRIKAEVKVGRYLQVEKIFVTLDDRTIAERTIGELTTSEQKYRIAAKVRATALEIGPHRLRAILKTRYDRYKGKATFERC